MPGAMRPSTLASSATTQHTIRSFPIKSAHESCQITRRNNENKSNFHCISILEYFTCSVFVQNLQGVAYYHRNKKYIVELIKVFTNINNIT